MSIQNLLSPQFSDVNASFIDRLSFYSDRDAARKAEEWADLDAMPASAVVPMPTGAQIPQSEAWQALQWIDCLPREDRRRLIEIAADRIGVDARNLPSIDDLRAALDRPEPPRGWADWRDAIDSATQRRRPLSGGIHRWSAYMVDREQEWLGRRAEWLAVARWHGLAVEVCRLMSDLHPASTKPDIDVECMSPRGRGTRLMDVPESEVCAIAKSLADRRLVLLETRRAAGIATDDLTPDERREIDPIHWRRVLRREARMARQYWQAALGLAWHGGARYCADRTLARYLERRAAAQAWAESMQVQGPDGEMIDLATVKEASERAKVARLFVNTKGMEDLARRAGLKALFLTLTLPSEYHPRPMSRPFADRAWTPQSSPEVAKQVLRDEWAKLRARWHRKGIYLFGVSVKEACQDGTLHMHVLLWVPADKVATAVEAMDKVFYWQMKQEKRWAIIDKKEYEENPENKRKGKKGCSAASYLLKYITKAISVDNAVIEAAGFGLKDSVIDLSTDEIDFDPADKIADFDRVRAQMSEAGTRRYALHGVHGIQRIWQKVLSARPEAAVEMPERAQEARSIMHRASAVADAAKEARRAGDADQWRERSAEAAALWGNALIALGAVAIDAETGRLARPEERLRGGYVETVNRYGETCRRWDGIYDAETGEYWVALRWAMVKKSSSEAIRTLADRVPRGGSSDPPGDPPAGGEARIRARLRAAMASTPTPAISI